MRGFIYFFKFSWSANKKYIFSVVLKTILNSLIGLSILILPQYLIDSIITRELRNIIFCEYSNAIVHAFQKFRAPFSGKIVHIFPEQSAVI